MELLNSSYAFMDDYVPMNPTFERSGGPSALRVGSYFPGIMSALNDFCC
jgi:hypothetical protein